MLIEEGRKMIIEMRPLILQLPLIFNITYNKLKNKL